MLRGILRTWTFWYFLAPAFLVPLMIACGPPETQASEVFFLCAGVFIAHAAVPLYVVDRLSQTLAPLWVYELALLVWALVAGAVAHLITARREVRRGLTCHCS
jgi:hypothetical protein